MEQRTIFKDVAALQKQERWQDALWLLRDALRRGQLDPEGVDKAGRLCSALFQRSQTSPLARVLVLGQCTTTWIATTLTATAWGQGVALAITDGAYDNVIQELLTVDTHVKYDIVVFLPWTQRLFFGSNGRPLLQRIEEERRFWRQAWQLASERLSARILQVGYDWTGPGTHGVSLAGKDDGEVAVIRRLNSELRDGLPTGAFFADLEQISGVLGRERFYDPRRYFWTKQPFSEAGTVRLVQHIWSGIRALLSGPKKILVLDLDNTLWGGVVGETGPLGVELGEGPDGEAYRAFQAHVKKLTERGVLLAAASKNNDADARGPFQQNPQMVLSLNDFADFQANWEPKAVGIQRIAQNLQLGLDSFVFFDDNPAEREHIRQALPDVEVVEVPDDPAEYIRALEAGQWFESTGLTAEDRHRAGQYQLERQRREVEQQFASLDDYLRSLAMIADVRKLDEPDLERAVQLIGKTNQFNLTTKRHSAQRVRQMLDDPQTVALTLRLADRFGDHGLVSVLIAQASDAMPETLEIDTWLMSCRVITRSVEQYFFNVLLEEVRRRGIRRLIGRYIETPKNALVKDVYDRLGFARRDTFDSRAIVYYLDIAHAKLTKTFVQPLTAAAECGVVV